MELPYTLAQDSTLFLFLGEPDIALWKQKVDWIAKHGGMVLVNVHPDYLAFDGRATHQVYPAGRYRELLEYIRDTYSGQYWHALPREVAAWVGSARREAVPVMSPVVEAIGRPSKDAASLAGKRVAVLLYSEYLSDPRPRRAAEALARAGMTVEVLSLRGNSAKTSGPQTVNGVRIWRVPLTHSREGVLRYLFQYAAFFLWSAAFCLRSWFVGRYDLVHVHNMPDFLALAALPAKLRGARVILDLHDPMPELYQAIYGLGEDHWMVSLLKELERQSIRFADRVLTPNLAFQRIFEQRSCDPGKIEIVMNSPEESVFMEDVPPAPLPPPPGDGPPFRVLHHGLIAHRHGLDIAIEAVAIAQQTIPTIQFIICGWPTPCLDEVLALAAGRGLSEVVLYLGPKTQPEIAAHVAACDVGVIPNRLSPFTAINMPTRIFEYLAVDRPVITPATEGIRDYFDESSLIFFRPDDAADLARQLIWVAQHPKEAADRVKSGKVVYRQQVWERQREHFLQLVKTLLAQ